MQPGCPARPDKATQRCSVTHNMVHYMVPLTLCVLGSTVHRTFCRSDVKALGTPLQGNSANAVVGMTLEIAAMGCVRGVSMQLCSMSREL